MKTLTSASAIAALAIGLLAIPYPAGAELKLRKLGGHLRLRTEASDRTDAASERGTTYLRVRPAATLTIDGDADLFLQPQFTKAFGDPANTSGSTTDPSLSVHQAYVDYHPVENFSLLGGRQALLYGDELVIGPLDWNNVGRSFDALRIRHTHSEGWLGKEGFVDLFASKITESNAAASGDGDKDLFGLYGSCNLGDAFKAVDVYGLHQLDATGTGVPSRLWTGGVRLKSTIDRFDYRAEGTKQWESNTSAYQADLEAGYTFDATATPRLALEGFTASRDYNQLYPTTHKWLGYADILGRRNVSGGVAHCSVNVLADTALFLDYHRFYRNDTGAAAFKINGTSALGNTARSSSKDVGQEIDLTVRHKASKSVTFSGGGSVFYPGEFLKGQFGTDRPTFYFVQMEVQF